MKWLSSGLRAPEYDISGTNTVVTLHSDAPRREAEAQSSVEAETGEFANLYPISGFGTVNGNGAARRLNFLVALKERLEAEDWFIDRFSPRRARGAPPGHLPSGAERRRPNRPHLSRGRLPVPRAFRFSIPAGGHEPYRCEACSPRPRCWNLSMPASWWVWRVLQNGGVGNRHASYHSKSGRCRVFLPDYAQEEVVSADHVIPQLPRGTV